MAQVPEAQAVTLAVERSLGSQSYRYLTGGKICQYRGDGKGRRPAGTKAHDRLFLFFHGAQSADGRTDVHPHSFGASVVYDYSCIRRRHLGGRQGINDKIVQTAQFFFIDEGQGIEVLDLTGNPRCKVPAVEFRYFPDSRFSRTEAVPRF